MGLLLKHTHILVIFTVRYNKQFLKKNKHYVKKMKSSGEGTDKGRRKKKRKE